MTAKKVSLTFDYKEASISGVVSYYFTAPKAFSYVAGQYLQLTIPHDTDDRGTSRYFSIASAPGEKELLIVTRQSKSSFKKHLFALTPGDTVAAFGPIGTFVVKD